MKSSVVLGLHGPEPFFLLFLLTFYCLLLHLMGSLVEDALDLVFSKSFEVVGLESVVSEHAFGCAEVFGHEVVLACVLLLMLAPPCKVLFFLSFSIALFLCQLEVCISGGVPQRLSLLFMHVLCVFKLLVLMNHLLMDQVVTSLLCLFNQAFLSQLLRGPVCHLHLLHFSAVAVA